MEKENLKIKNILFSVDNVLDGEILKSNIEKHLKLKFNKVFYIEDELKNKGIIFKILRETIGKAKKDSIFYRIYKKVSRDFIYQELKRYKNLDYFFILSEGSFSKETIFILRKLNKNIKIILFLWDKFDLTYYKDKIELFDYIYSFDREDCERYNFNFRPSFYIDECNKNLKNYKKRSLDLYYICSLRERSRYDIIEKLSEYCFNNNLKSFLKVYIQGKNKLKNSKEELILNKKISYVENLEKIKNSKVCVDLKYKDQIGLTLRCYESLETSTKIITNNKDIKKYDFYNENNIKVIEKLEDIVNIDKDFFYREYEEILGSLKYKYSVSGFLEDMFSLGKSKQNIYFNEILKNNRRSRVTYDDKKEIFIKEFDPKIKKIFKYFFKLEKYPGYNFKYISGVLNSININTVEVKDSFKYKVTTKELKGESLDKALKKASKEKSKEYIEKYISLIQKLMKNKIYFADYSCDNFFVFNDELYALDLEDYRKDFLFIFRKKKMIKVMRTKLKTLPKESLEKAGLDYDIVYKKILDEEGKNNGE